MDKGFFNGLFDFDKDGKLNPMEQAMDFMAFSKLLDKTNNYINQINKSKDKDANEK